MADWSRIIGGNVDRCVDHSTSSKCEDIKFLATVANGAAADLLGGDFHLCLWQDSFGEG
jgi:hypothetical protein